MYERSNMFINEHGQLCIKSAKDYEVIGVVGFITGYTDWIIKSLQ